MSCCEANVVCSCNHTGDSAHEYCHPNLRENFRKVTPTEINVENSMRNRFTFGNCCYSPNPECFGNSHYHEASKNFRETGPEEHLHCVAHRCPLGEIVCCTDCKKSDCRNDKDIIKAKDISETQDGIICHKVPRQEPIFEDVAVVNEMSCCAKNTSWTEPTICQCGPCDPNGYMKRCRCEHGESIYAKCSKEKPKKKVRFADEVVKTEDCEKAFRNLDMEDIKYLCTCCKECAVIGKEQSVGKPVLVYELPEQKLEDTTVTQKDFCWQKTPLREVPPWHPNSKDRWRHLDVPSLCETIYQCDFKPPPVTCAERKPIYLAPQRVKIDPCQQLAEEFCCWKKTSTDKKHTCHSKCDECDKDFQRMHLHECDITHLPPQYRCNGNGHLCQPSYQTKGEKFTLCEKGDKGESLYRACCVPKEKDREKLTCLPPDLMKPACPSYTTSYKHDFKDPYRLRCEKLCFGNYSFCNACSRPQGDEQPNLLCTKNTREPVITQRAGIV